MKQLLSTQPGFGGSAEQPFLGLLAPKKSREGEDFSLDLRLEDKIFLGAKLEAPFFFSIGW